MNAREAAQSERDRCPNFPHRPSVQVSSVQCPGRATATAPYGADTHDFNFESLKISESFGYLEPLQRIRSRQPCTAATRLACTEAEPGQIKEWKQRKRAWGHEQPAGVLIHLRGQRLGNCTKPEQTLFSSFLCRLHWQTILSQSLSLFTGLCYTRMANSGARTFSSARVGRLVQCVQQGPSHATVQFHWIDPKN